MSEISVQPLLTTPTVAIRDVYCQGRCRHQSAEECATAAHLVFPYRGVYVRHLGADEAVAEANQVLFFNRAEGYRVSHPVPGGDASLDLAISEPLLRELAPRSFLHDAKGLAFRQQRASSGCLGRGHQPGRGRPDTRGPDPAQQQVRLHFPADHAEHYRQPGAEWQNAAG